MHLCSFFGVNANLVSVVMHILSSYTRIYVIYTGQKHDH